MNHKKINIKPVQQQDIETLRRGHNDSYILNKLTNPLMVNEIQQQQWFNNLSKSKTSFGLTVFVNHTTIIGYIRLDHYDPINKSMQIGGDIFRNYRGKGYGSQMFEACLLYVFNNFSCNRAYLSVLETNKTAINMYFKYGFTQEGRQTQAINRNGVYIDYINMYLLGQKFYEDIYTDINI